MMEESDDVQATSMAYGERMCMEQAIAAARGCSDAHTRDVLMKYNLLMGLDCVRKELPWYMVNGLISKKQAGEITSLIHDLCRETCKYSLRLVEAFGIPNNQWPPMSMDWIE